MDYSWLKRKEDLENLKTAAPWGETLVKGDRHARARRRVRVALFDLDGTLVDTEDQYTVFWGATARKYRPDIPQLEHLIKGTTLKQIFGLYFPDPSWQAAIEAELDQWEASMDYTFFPGVREFLLNLKENGVMCAVVTSSNRTKMASVRRQVPDFDTLFEAVLTAEDFAASKPAPDCYRKGAAVFGAELDECVVFEDAFTGLAAGMASGIFTIGITTSHTREEIAERCHCVIDTFAGLDYARLTELVTLS